MSWIRNMLRDLGFRIEKRKRKAKRGFGIKLKRGTIPEDVSPVAILILLAGLLLTFGAIFVGAPDASSQGQQIAGLPSGMFWVTVVVHLFNFSVGAMMVFFWLLDRANLEFVIEMIVPNTVLSFAILMIVADLNHIPNSELMRAVFWISLLTG